MRNKRIFIILFVVMMMTFSIISVSAQDVDNMSNEQLTALLMAIMQRLDGSGEAAEMPEPTATPTPEPTKTPRPELSDDRAELEALMMAIMQKLQQEETQGPENVPTDVPLTDPVPTATMIPVLEPEPMGFSTYENKKLIVEALPGYIFIQPTKEEPGNSEGTQPENKPEHYNNEPDIDEYGVNCHWYFVQGKWLCMYG